MATCKPRDPLLNDRKEKGVRKKKVSGTIVLLFSRSASWPKRDLQVELLGDPIRPFGISKWRPACDAAAQGCQFGFRLRLLQMAEPLPRASHRPFTQDLLREVVLPQSVVET